DLDAAVGWNRLAIEENPQYFDAYNNLAHCLLDLGRPEEAIPLLEVALAINPDEVGVLTNLGTAEAMRGNVDAARHRWRRALAMDPAAFHPNKNLAILARESGDGAGYQHHLERAATAPDATGDVLAEWGDLLAQQGRPDEAAAAWTEAVRRGVGPEREADLRARTAP
ncbi:MAG TPA: tetratricopeptide repeat protein, partial [bacterium]|nr:tetratricopeptide repeat protein [bacterium]